MARFMFPLICQGVLHLHFSHELAQAPPLELFQSIYLFISWFRGAALGGMKKMRGVCLRPRSHRLPLD